MLTFRCTLSFKRHSTHCDVIETLRFPSSGDLPQRVQKTDDDESGHRFLKGLIADAEQGLCVDALNAFSFRFADGHLIEGA